MLDEVLPRVSGCLSHLALVGGLLPVKVLTSDTSQAAAVARLLLLKVLPEASGCLSQGAAVGRILPVEVLPGPFGYHFEGSWLLCLVLVKPRPHKKAEEDNPKGSK